MGSKSMRTGYQPPKGLRACLVEAERRLRIGGGLPKLLRERIVMLLAAWGGREAADLERDRESRERKVVAWRYRHKQAGIWYLSETRPICEPPEAYEVRALLED